VRIGRGGLDGAQTDLKGVNLVGRAVVVDGKLTAVRNATVSGGAQSFDVASRTATAQAGSGSRPAYAVDATAYGAMRAGEITIVGTEAGLGVRMQGDMKAQTGDLSVKSSGNLELASGQSAGDLNIFATGEYTQTRDFSSQGTLTLSAGSFSGEERSGLYASGFIDVSAANGLSFAGDIQTLETLDLDTSQDLTFSGFVIAEEDIAVTAGGDLLLDAGALFAYDIDIDVGGLADFESGYFALSDPNQGGITITTDDIRLTDGFSINFPSQVTVVADGDFINEADMRNFAGINLTYGGNLQNSGIFYDENLVMNSSGWIYNEGVIYGGTTLDLTAFGLENTATGIIFGGTTDLVLSDDVINDGTIVSSNDLTITAQNLENSNSINSDGALTLSLSADGFNTGTITSAGALNYSSQLFQNEGLIASTDVANFNVTTLDNQATGTIGADDLVITSATLFANEGTLSIQSSGLITADGVDNTGSISSAGDLAFALASTDLFNSGLIESAGLFELNSDELINSGVLLVGDADVALLSNFDNTGTIYGTGLFELTALDVDNVGTFVGLGGITADATTYQNSGAIFSTGLVDLQGDTFTQTITGRLGAGDADLAFTGQFSNDGSVRFTGNALIDADTILSTGELSSGGILTLDGATAISIAGLATGEGGLFVDTVDLTVAANSELSGDGGLITASNSVSNQGRIFFSGQGGIDTATLTNNGDIGSQAGLDLIATTLTNSGLIVAAILDVDADILTNQTSGTIGANVAEFTLAASLINDGLISLSSAATIDAVDVTNTGTLSAEDSLVVTTNADLNNTGTLASTDVMTLTVGNAFSNAGLVFGGNDLDLVSAQFDNQTTGTIGGSDGNITTSVVNNQGQIVLSQDVLVTAAAINNSGFLVGNQSLDLDIAGGAITTSGLLQGGVLTVDSATLAVQTGGQVLAGQAAITLTGQMTNDGLVETVGDLTLASAGLTSTGSILIGGTFDVDLGADDLINSGAIEAVTAFDLTAQNLDNSGSIAAGESLVTLAGNFANSGSYAHISNFEVTAASFENSGDLFAPGTIDIDVTGVADLGGNFASGGHLTVLADQIIGTTAGTMSVGADLLLNSATTIELGVATIVGGDAWLTTANGGPITVNDRLQAQLVTLESQDVTIGTNGVVAGNHLDLLGTNILNIAGEVAVNTLDPLTQSQITISGSVYTRDSITIDSADVTIASGGIVGAGYLSNAQTLADLIVTVDNLVIDGSLAATRDVSINRRDGALLSVNGQLYAGNILDVTAGALSFGAGGGAHAGLNTTLTSLTGDIDFAGSGSAGANFVLASAQDITLTGAGGSSPDIEAGFVDFDAVRDITSSAWTASTYTEINAGRDITLSGRTDAFNASNTAGYATINAGRALTQGGALNTAGVVVLESATNLTNSGAIKAAQIDVIVPDTFTNTGSLSARDALYVDATNASITPDIINHGTLAANNFVSLRGASIDNRSGGRIEGGDIQIVSNTWLNNAGTMDAGNSGSLDINVAGQLTNSGTLKGEVVNASAGSGFSLSNSSFIGGDVVLLFTNNNTTLRGDIRGNSAVLVNVGNADLTTYGDIWAGNGGSYQLASNQSIQGINLIAGEWDHRSGGSLESRSDIFVDADDRAEIDGTIDALGDIVILANYNGSSQSGRVDLDINNTINGGTTTLLVTNDIQAGTGDINGQNAVTIEATTLRDGGNTNFMDLVASGGDLSLTLDQGLTLGSGDSLEVGGDLMLALQGNVVINNGTLHAGGDLILSTGSGSITNTSGVIKADDDLSLDAGSGDLINRGGTIEAGGNMALKAQDIENGSVLSSSISTQRFFDVAGQQYDYNTVMASLANNYANYVQYTPNTPVNYSFHQSNLPNPLLATINTVLRQQYGAEIPLFIRDNHNYISMSSNWGVLSAGAQLRYNSDGLALADLDALLIANSDTRLVERVGYFAQNVGPSFIISGGNLHVDADTFSNVDATVSVGGNAQFDVTSSFKNLRQEYTQTSTYFRDRMDKTRHNCFFGCTYKYRFRHEDITVVDAPGADPQSSLIAVDGNLVVNGASGPINTTPTQTSTNVGGLSVVNTGFIQANSVLIIGQQITTGVGGSPFGQNVGSSGANLNNNNVAANYNDGRNGVSTANYNGPTSGASGPSTVNGAGMSAGNNVSQVATANNPNVTTVANTTSTGVAAGFSGPNAVAMTGPANTNQGPFTAPDLGPAPGVSNPDFNGTFNQGPSLPPVGQVVPFGFEGDADVFAQTQGALVDQLTNQSPIYLDGQYASAQDQYGSFVQNNQLPMAGQIVAKEDVTLIADYIDIGADIITGGDLNITAFEDLEFTSYQTTNTYSGRGDIGTSFQNGDVAATQAMFDDRNANGQDTNSRFSLTRDDKYTYGTGGRGSHEITETLTHGVSLNVGGNVNLVSHGDITLHGTQIDAFGNIGIMADGDIVALATQDLIETSHSWKKKGFLSKKSYSRNTMDVINTPVTLTSANGDIILDAGNDIYTAGTVFDAQNGTVGLHADNEIYLGFYQDISVFEEHKSSSSFFGLFGSSSDFQQTIKDQMGSSLDGQHGLSFSTDRGDLTLFASHLASEGTLSLSIGGDLILQAGVDSTTTLSQTMDNNGITITTITESEDIQVGDYGSIDVGGFDLNIAGQVHAITYNGNITDAINDNGEMAQTFVPDLWQAFNPDTVTTYGLTNEYFYDEQVALNPAFKALLMTVVMPYVGGQLGWIVANPTTAMQFATNAFASSGMMGFTEGIITGNFDPADILQNAAMAGITAGLGAELAMNWNINNLPNDVLFEIGNQTVTIDSFLNGGLDNFIQASINSAAFGGNVWDHFGQLALNDTVSIIQAGLQNEIGALFENDNLGGEGSPLHILLHGMVGCGVAEALDGNCASGFAAGGAQAFYAGQVNPWAAFLDPDGYINQAEVIGAFVGYFTSGGNPANVFNGAEIAASGFENNLLCGGICIGALIAAGLVILAEGGGDPLEGLRVIGAGESLIQQLAAAGAGEVLAFSNEHFPDQTAAVIDTLISVGEAANVVVSYVDDLTGNVVSAAWNELPQDVQDQIKGGFTVASFTIPATTATRIGRAMPDVDAPNVGLLMSPEGPDVVFRGDSRSPEEIFESGFEPLDPGSNTSLEDYVIFNDDSNFVGTSTSFSVAGNFANGRFVYDIDRPNFGIDVNSAFPTNPLSHEMEVAVPGGIDTSMIRGAQLVDSSGQPIGDYIPNPNYGGG
jgi:adhesin HecA-like repeat protein